MNDLLKNLQIKNQSNFLIINLPEELINLGDALPFPFKVNPEKSHDFIMIFAKSMIEAKLLISQCMPILAEDGLLWFCYPKQSGKKYKSDINRDKSWDLFTDYNFRPVRQISLNDDWSALRFRDVKYVKGK